jgi:hypothetical protein
VHPASGAIEAGAEVLRLAFYALCNYVLLVPAGPEAVGGRGERFRAPIMPILTLYAGPGRVRRVLAGPALPASALCVFPTLILGRQHHQQDHDGDQAEGGDERCHFEQHAESHSLSRSALRTASLVVYISRNVARQQEYQGDEPDAAQERQALHDHKN